RPHPPHRKLRLRHIRLLQDRRPQHHRPLPGPSESRRQQGPVGGRRSIPRVVFRDSHGVEDQLGSGDAVDILLSIFVDYVKRRGPRWAYVVAAIVATAIIAFCWILTALYGG